MRYTHRLLDRPGLEHAPHFSGLNLNGMQRFPQALQLSRVLVTHLYGIELGAEGGGVLGTVSAYVQDKENFGVAVRNIIIQLIGKEQHGGIPYIEPVRSAALSYIELMALYAVCAQLSLPVIARSRTGLVDVLDAP